ncbi:hypothetical protein AVEN_169082-1 [Araneus ventricosus]|uniref:Uncharacterized protein n=1 Tax=Araneus ventricosus TaxID=182803 RepID=A0A4Y2DII0_ARAVE|nr:hypothetical protein AVEN_8752-1 [Araneus ventricosus]GBM15773.1 hypothetical protein AVEN_70418-1 [Araneus ventricosus]GBM15805.1 hypothetical protein AVEN_149273-1 [Araneus ventricosus]GBM15828.1 hypothetical protein AVEN_169082-1 [Araneus ventricosus]
MEENCIDEKSIKASGCDDTATNTGASNGSIELFKSALKHPLEAVVCLFHLFLVDDLKILSDLQRNASMVLFVGYTYLLYQSYPYIGSNIRTCEFWRNVPRKA